MVADTWMCDNALVCRIDNPPFDLKSLEIPDCELEAEDLAALADTEE